MVLMLTPKGGKNNGVHIAYQKKLIMLHCDFISAQFDPDEIGLCVTTCLKTNTLDIEFTTLGDAIMNYQRWSFDLDDNFEMVRDFFRLIGFTRPQSYRANKL